MSGFELVVLSLVAMNGFRLELASRVHVQVVR